MPVGSKDAYSTAAEWKDFLNIIDSLSGIEDIVIDNSDAPIEYFNLNGARVDNPEQGIFIKRQGNKVEKVIIN